LSILENRYSGRFYTTSSGVNLEQVSGSIKDNLWIQPTAFFNRAGELYKEFKPERSKGKFEVMAIFNRMASKPEEKKNFFSVAGV